MPFIYKEKAIYTKVLDVTEYDHPPGRQALLLDMYLNPEILDSIYLDHLDVMVTVCGAIYKIGRIRDKYATTLSIHQGSRITAWKITGGSQKPIEGYGSDKKQFVGYLGLNIKIELS